MHIFFFSFRLLSFRLFFHWMERWENYYSDHSRTLLQQHWIDQGLCGLCWQDFIPIQIRMWDWSICCKFDMGSVYVSIYPSIHPSPNTNTNPNCTTCDSYSLRRSILYEKGWPAIFSWNIWQATLSIYLWIPKWCHAVLRAFLIKTVTSLFSLHKWLADAERPVCERKNWGKTAFSATHFKQNCTHESI